MMKTYFTLLLLHCVAVNAVAVNSIAQPLRLVTGNGYAPYTGESLPQRGMVTEIVEQAFAAVGDKVTIDFRPWRRGYEETKAGFFVGTFPYIKTADRERDFLYSDSINSVYVRVFVDRDSHYQTLDDLEGARICIPLGFAVNEKISRFLESQSIRQAAHPTDLATCFRMLSYRRMDFIVINEINGWSTVKNAALDKTSYRTLETTFHEDTHHLIVSKNYPGGEHILARFNEGLNRLSRQGVLKEIIDRHLRAILH